MTDQADWAGLMRVRIEYYSGSQRYGREDFAMEVVDREAGMALAVLRAEESPFFNCRVPDRTCLVWIAFCNHGAVSPVSKD